MREALESTGFAQACRARARVSQSVRFRMGQSPLQTALERWLRENPLRTTRLAAAAAGLPAELVEKILKGHVQPAREAVQRLSVVIGVDAERLWANLQSRVARFAIAEERLRELGQDAQTRITRARGHALDRTAKVRAVIGWK